MKMRSVDELVEIGKALNRPECVLCTADGSLYVSDWGGGVCHIRPDGTQRRYLAIDASSEILPNGIALLEDRSFLLANLGDEGGVWKLHRNGHVEKFLDVVDGQALPPCNFVLLDSVGRVWITVSTTVVPRDQAYRHDVADGFIVLVDERGARVVADGLGYTNEVQVHPSGEWLYVNETFSRKLSRFRIDSNGDLVDKETVTEFGAGVFPDGLCFDQEGAIWVVSIVSNRLIRILPNGEQALVLEDVAHEHLQYVETAFQAGQMGRPHLDKVVSARLRNTSSVAFGGPAGRTCYLGCLLGETIMSMDMPVAGIEPAHWQWY